MRADRTAVVARIACAADSSDGSKTSFALEDVASGQQDFTAGCFISTQGRGTGPRRLALGTCTGDVEVYAYVEGGGRGEAGGGGLETCESVVEHPTELDMGSDVEV